MIILRKLESQSSSSNCRFVMADSLVGLTDGVNQTFAVTYDYAPGNIEILYNGQVLNSPEDFDEYGAPTASGLAPNEIKFTYLAPTDITVLSANYQVGDCGDELGSANFIELTDTPTTYSGFEGQYLRVNSTGDGIEFVLPTGDTEEGITNIPVGVTSVDVTFSNAFDNDNYILTISLENKVDAEPSVYPILIKNKTVTGFTAEFSGDVDSDNYHLNWRATLPGSGPPGAGGSGISAVVEDSSPELGGHLEVGSHLLMLDPHPNGLSIHGYAIGYSGDASKMTVYDNPTGFACPLYMKSNGQWAACTAVSGTTQMPCVALALEEEEGQTNILWRGIVRKGSWSWIPGQKIYVSTAEGAVTNVKPSGGAWPQVIGIAISSDTIRFDPDLASENPNS
jgi:hypothetical protein